MHTSSSAHTHTHTHTQHVLILNDLLTNNSACVHDADDYRIARKKLNTQEGAAAVQHDSLKCRAVLVMRATAVLCNAHKFNNHTVFEYSQLRIFVISGISWQNIHSAFIPSGGVGQQNTTNGLATLPLSSDFAAIVVTRVEHINYFHAARLW